MTMNQTDAPPRRNLIDALAYPRRVLQAQIDLQRCPHAGFFSPGDVGCQDCDDRPECQWLYHNDEFVALERKNDHDLLQALDFAICFVTAQVAGHDARTCTCPSCKWLRGAQGIYDAWRPTDRGRESGV